MNLLILHGGFRRLPALLLLCFPALASAQVLSPAYEAVVRRYQSGDREGAVADLSSWPEERLRGEVAALSAFREKARACHPCAASMSWRQIPVRAALVLHGDCALRARRGGEPSSLHKSLALEIARLLKDDPTQRAFAGRWYETMAGLAQGENLWGEALDWAERGLRDFPDSARMLLVVGSIEETVGALATLRLPDGVFSPVQRETRENLDALREAHGHLEKARRSLRSAVAADPSLAEARLRLGRVAWRLGDALEARAALLEVLSREPRPDTAFLAHLFIGRLDEDAGRLDDAGRSYEAALALDPRAQSARLALSHARLRRGSPGIARREVEESVRASGQRLQPDPFWLYPWGPARGAEDRLEALREEASR